VIFNHRFPLVGVHFLVSHKSECFGDQVAGFDALDYVWVFQIGVYGAKPVFVNGDEYGIVPFFNDFLISSLLDCVVENADFQIIHKQVLDLMGLAESFN
jgi:hypothetical protein